MWRTLGIEKDEWQQTSALIQARLISLRHESHSASLRASAYRPQIDLLNQPAARLSSLQNQIAVQRKLILELQQQVARTTELSAQITRLTAENAELREQLGQNSTNSSRPPSYDSPFRQASKPTQTTGRSQGAQIGHRGRGRLLANNLELARIVALRPEICRRCNGSQFEPVDWLPARRQVVEITNNGTLITEYQRHALRCASCGIRNRANWHTAASQGAFGARVKAVIAYLTGRLNLSHRDTVEAMQELFRVKISLGSVSAVQKRISRFLARPVARIEKFIERQTVTLVDETGWREKGKKPWLWVKTTKQATVFRILPGRRKTDAQTTIGENAHGVVTTDRYPGYNFIPLPHRQICWAHLKRDFRAISERSDDSQPIGAGLLEETEKLFKLWHRIRDGTLPRSVLHRELESIKRKIFQLILEGTNSENSKTKNTCLNLLKLELALWTFTRIEGVEPTNNQAERMLRRAVLWRKRSFGTQSATGSRFVALILTVVATLQQQRRSVLDYLNRAVTPRVFKFSFRQTVV